MDQILYATDCSEFSSATLRFAIAFAKKMNAQLNLVYAYSLAPIENTTLRPQKQLKRHAHSEKLSLLKSYYNTHAPATNIEKRTNFYVEESPSISTVIRSKAQELSADLVIVGRKDKHSKRGLFAGNIASVLMEKLATPLLVVPNISPSIKIKTILYATDFEADDIIALSQLREVAIRLNAGIKVVHIPTKKEYSSSEQMEWFKEMVTQKIGAFDVEYHLLLSGDVKKGLNTFIESSKADLLCMLERDEKGPLQKFIFGDTVKQMKALCTIPMLSYNRKSIV